MADSEQEKYMRFKVIESHMQETIAQMEFFEEQAGQLNDAVNSLKKLPELKVGTPIYVQFAHGVRIKARIEATDHVMVHVGSDVTVHKTPDEAVNLISEQLAAVQQFGQRLEEKLQKLSQMADEINRGN
jgi:prefoldin alpha subunit